MNTARIREIQAKTGYPHSASLRAALMQVWHEIDCDEKKVKELSDEEIKASEKFPSHWSEAETWRYGAKWARDYILGKDNG